jgi:hypothetical protein
VEVSPELGTRKRLTVLNVRDELGRTVDSGGTGSGGGSYSFNFKPKPDARSLAFSLAVQEVVLGEFVVKPTPFVPNNLPGK